VARRHPGWNLNIHYHQVVLDAVFPDAVTALDVGCGDGLLAFDLADRGLQVTGLDTDEASIERAQSCQHVGDQTQFVVGDLLSCPFEPESFDVVASIAMLHHIDAERGIRRMRELVRAGGVLVIVGFARPSTVADRVRALVGTVWKRSAQLTGRYWEHQAPVAWPPPLSSKEMAALVQRELPGATYRNVLSNRYTVVWKRDVPGDEAPHTPLTDAT
jgi:SAM-dependent methyltransferase